MDTANTWIYTYGHTRTLHDALPSLVEGGLDQDARAAQADLPGILERRAHQDGGLVAPVAVGEHQGRVLAAQIQRHLLQHRRGDTGDALADRGAAGERHRPDRRVHDHRLADLRAEPAHDVEHARGEPALPAPLA